MLPVTPGKEPPYSLIVGLIWSQSHCRRFGVRKNILPVPVIETRLIRCPGLSVGTVPTVLGTTGWGYSLRSRFSELQMGGGLVGHVTIWYHHVSE